MSEPIGYRWLVDQYGLAVTQALRVQTVVGPSRSVVREEGTELRTVQEKHGAARARLKDIVEGPDDALDRIIRSVRDSRGTISGKLRSEYPILERAEIAEDVVRAIREEFPWAMS